MDIIDLFPGLREDLEMESSVNLSKDNEKNKNDLENEISIQNSTNYINNTDEEENSAKFENVFDFEEQNNKENSDTLFEDSVEKMLNDSNKHMNEKKNVVQKNEKLVNQEHNEFDSMVDEVFDELDTSEKERKNKKKRSKEAVEKRDTLKICSGLSPEVKDEKTREISEIIRRASINNRINTANAFLGISNRLLKYENKAYEKSINEKDESDTKDNAVFGKEEPEEKSYMKQKSTSFDYSCNDNNEFVQSRMYEEKDFMQNKTINEKHKFTKKYIENENFVKQNLHVSNAVNHSRNYNITSNNMIWEDNQQHNQKNYDVAYKERLNDYKQQNIDYLQNMYDNDHRTKNTLQAKNNQYHIKSHKIDIFDTLKNNKNNDLAQNSCYNDMCSKDYKNNYISSKIHESNIVRQDLKAQPYNKTPYINIGSYNRNSAAYNLIDSCNETFSQKNVHHSNYAKMNSIYEPKFANNDSFNLFNKNTSQKMKHNENKMYKNNEHDVNNKNNAKNNYEHEINKFNNMKMTKHQNLNNTKRPVHDKHEIQNNLYQNAVNNETFRNVQQADDSMFNYNVKNTTTMNNNMQTEHLRNMKRYYNKKTNDLYSNTNNKMHQNTNIHENNAIFYNKNANMFAYQNVVHNNQVVEDYMTDNENVVDSKFSNKSSDMTGNMSKSINGSFTSNMKANIPSNTNGYLSNNMIYTPYSNVNNIYNEKTEITNRKYDNLQKNVNNIQFEKIQAINSTNMMQNKNIYNNSIQPSQRDVFYNKQYKANAYHGDLQNNAKLTQAVFNAQSPLNINTIMSNPNFIQSTIMSKNNQYNVYEGNSNNKGSRFEENKLYNNSYYNSKNDIKDITTNQNVRRTTPNQNFSSYNLFSENSMNKIKDDQRYIQAHSNVNQTLKYNSDFSNVDINKQRMSVDFNAQTRYNLQQINHTNNIQNTNYRNNLQFTNQNINLYNTNQTMSSYTKNHIKNINATNETIHNPTTNNMQNKDLYYNDQKNANDHTKNLYMNRNQKGDFGVIDPKFINIFQKNNIKIEDDLKITETKNNTNKMINEKMIHENIKNMQYVNHTNDQIWTVQKTMHKNMENEDHYKTLNSNANCMTFNKDNTVYYANSVNKNMNYASLENNTKQQNTTKMYNSNKQISDLKNKMKEASTETFNHKVNYNNYTNIQNVKSTMANTNNNDANNNTYKQKDQRFTNVYKQNHDSVMYDTTNYYNPAQEYASIKNKNHLQNNLIGENGMLQQNYSEMNVKPYNNVSNTNFHTIQHRLDKKTTINNNYEFNSNKYFENHKNAANINFYNYNANKNEYNTTDNPQQNIKNDIYKTIETQNVTNNIQEKKINIQNINDTNIELQNNQNKFSKNQITSKNTYNKDNYNLINYFEMKNDGTNANLVNFNKLNHLKKETGNIKKDILEEEENGNSEMKCKKMKVNKIENKEKIKMMNLLDISNSMDNNEMNYGKSICNEKIGVEIKNEQYETENSKICAIEDYKNKKIMNEYKNIDDFEEKRISMNKTYNFDKKGETIQIKNLNNNKMKKRNETQIIKKIEANKKECVKSEKEIFLSYFVKDALEDFIYENKIERIQLSDVEMSEMKLCMESKSTEIKSILNNFIRFVENNIEIKNKNIYQLQQVYYQQEGVSKEVYFLELKDIVDKLEYLKEYVCEVKISNKLYDEEFDCKKNGINWLAQQIDDVKKNKDIEVEDVFYDDC